MRPAPVRLWDAGTGKPLRTLEGRRAGPSTTWPSAPTSRLLVSGSRDGTCKVWRGRGRPPAGHAPPAPQGGIHLRLRPDGRSIVARHLDDTIRVWEFAPSEPAADRTLWWSPGSPTKARSSACWRSPRTARGSSPPPRTGPSRRRESANSRNSSSGRGQPDISRRALSVNGDGKTFRVGRMDGSVGNLSASPPWREGREDVPAGVAGRDPRPPATRATAAAWPSGSRTTTRGGRTTWRSPRPSPGPSRGAQTAGRTSTPTILGEGQQAVGSSRSRRPAGRSRSSTRSSRCSTTEGVRLERVPLQAVRDSYFTFRGKDDGTVNDFRVFNWEEMRLDGCSLRQRGGRQALALPAGAGFRLRGPSRRGEAVGLLRHHPAGPRAGRAVLRLVRPHPPGTALVPNGLPTFSLYFENDDESHRELSEAGSCISPRRPTAATWRGSGTSGAWKH